MCIPAGITALFGITKPVGIIRGQPRPARLRKKDVAPVLEVGMSHI